MTTSTVGEFCWNDLATPNLDAAKAFYSKLLGWEFTDTSMEYMTYSMININNGKAFGGMWQIPTDKQNDMPPHWMSYILVEDLDATLQQAETLGATIKMPAMQAGDHGRFAIIADPTNAYVAFWESAKK